MAKGKKTPGTGAQTPATGTATGAQTPAANGAADGAQTPATPAVVGINFGNTYASIAIISQEGLAECIANEDGERQIACAVSFHGDQTYIGSGAKQQLVKNGANTILGFRNLLGKKFSEIPKDQPVTSAPVVQHPSEPDTPAYIVHAGADEAERVLSVSDVATLFLKSLLASAKAYMGRAPTGAVLTVPEAFDGAQRAALTAAAEAAGVRVLQLLPEPGAAALATAGGAPDADRTQLLVDLGQSALSLALVSLRHGLAHVLAASTTPAVAGAQIDDALVRFFAKDFAKKTKTALAVAPAPAGDKGAQRAEARLRLALEHTRRTVAASAGAAACAVESLFDGLDYAGSVNRLRFDMEARPVYAAVARAARELLEEAGVDGYAVDEVVYVGGAGCLPGLGDALAPLFAEEVAVASVDPTEVLARGCALQADLLAGLARDADADVLGPAFAGGSAHEAAPVLARTLGALFPGAGAGEMGGAWVPLVRAETALPARRTVALSVAVGAKGRVGLEFWEATEGVKVTREKPPPLGDEDGEAEDEDEEDEVEVRERVTTKETCLGGLAFDVSHAKGGKAALTLQAVVRADGSVEVAAWEDAAPDTKARFTVGA